MVLAADHVSSSEFLKRPLKSTSCLMLLFGCLLSVGLDCVCLQQYTLRGYDTGLVYQLTELFSLTPFISSSRCAISRGRVGVQNIFIVLPGVGLHILSQYFLTGWCDSFTGTYVLRLAPIAHTAHTNLGRVVQANVVELILWLRY